METSEVLNRAADLIEERGWTTGPSGMLVDGPHCIQGAIQAAVGGPRRRLEPGKYHYLDYTPCPAGAAVRDYLNVPGYTQVWMWNDTRRTAAEVVEVLRASAVIEAAREQETAEVPS